MEKTILEIPLVEGSHEDFVSYDAVGRTRTRRDEEGTASKEARIEGELASEAKKQLWLAGPIIVTFLLQSILRVVSLMFVGHLGELALSGASLATSLAGVTGIYTMIITAPFFLLQRFIHGCHERISSLNFASWLQMGLGSALDKLCGQAHGAKQYHMLGIYMQRVMLLILVSIPVAGLWFYTKEILLLWGQDPEIAHEAGSYSRWMHTKLAKQ